MKKRARFDDRILVGRGSPAHWPTRAGQAKRRGGVGSKEAIARVPRVLILGGTAEAVALAEACVARRGLEVISSLAGRTRTPVLPPGEVRSGGFGGAEGLARFLVERGIDRVIDATHPFAVQIGANAEQASRQVGVPRLRLLRAPWPREPGDRWVEVADLGEAARRLPELGRRAFLTVGHRDLEAFAGLDVWFLVRTIEPPGPSALPRVEWIAGRGPFDVAHEIALLRAHGIDVLVTKASGGEATYAKLVAARRLGLPVVMVRRPLPPPGPVVDSVEAALAWLERPA
jgi:precorrin-6A/cobalt-precorrin-6A reductase